MKTSFTKLSTMVLACVFFLGKVQAQTSSFGNLPAFQASTSANAVASSVDLATGRISPSLPLLSLAGRSVTIPVSVNYSAGSGVRSTDVATEVGLGWNLSAGGYIQREVRDRPDESNTGWLNRSTLYYGKMPGEAIDILKAAREPITADPNNLYPQNTSGYKSQLQFRLQAMQNENEFDSEPDIYTIVLPTGSASFVFDKDGLPVLLKADNLKIEVSKSTVPNTSTAYPNLLDWAVTTTDGTKYLFGGQDFTEKTTVSTTTIAFQGQANNTDYSNCSTKWWLRQIVSSTNEEFNFEYRDAYISVNYANQLRCQYLFTANGNHNPVSYSTDTPYSPDFNYATNTLQYRMWDKTYEVITNVSTSTKQITAVKGVVGSLLFTYQSQPRQDVSGNTFALESIQLVNMFTQKIKSLSFSYDYSIYTNSLSLSRIKSHDYKHLMLSHIDDITNSCAALPQYVFTYKNQPFPRNTRATDAWGYINSNSSAGHSFYSAVQKYAKGSLNLYRNPGADIWLSGEEFYGVDRVISEEDTQALILKTIGFGIGSTVSYEYQSHDYYDVSTQNAHKILGGLRIKRIVIHDGISTNNNLVKQYTYTKENSSVSSGCFADAGVYARLRYMRGGAPSGNFDWRNGTYVADPRTVKPANPYSSPPGVYDKRDYYYFIRAENSFYAYASDYIDYSRVEVKENNGGSTAYTFTNWAEESHQDYVEPLSYQLSSPSASSWFTSYKSAETNINDIYQNFLPRKNSRAPERGLLTGQKEYNSAGIVVREITNEYEVQNKKTVDAVVVMPDLEVIEFTQYSLNYQIFFYKHFSKFIPLIRTTEIIYDQNNPGISARSITKTSEYEYSNLAVSKIISWTKDDISNRKFIASFQRPLDFADSPLTPDNLTTAGLLRSKHLLGVVVEQRNAVLQNGVETTIGAEYIEFKDWGNGLILPYRMYTAQSNMINFNPASTSYGSSTGWSLNTDSRYELNSTITDYNSTGQPINSQNRSGITSGTIYGYNSAIPVATVFNATTTSKGGSMPSAATAAYTSLEENIDGDHWSTANKYSNTEAKTGRRSALLQIVSPSTDDYSPSKALVLPSSEQKGKFILSCWVKVPKGVTASSICKLVTVGTENTPQQYTLSDGTRTGWRGSQDYSVVAGQDWKYVEQIIDLDDTNFRVLLPTNGAAIRLVCYVWFHQGAALLVDEIRVHRTGAVMNTMTFEPLVGKTSQMSANGRASYFEYDTRNELRLIRDHNYDIISRTKSHIANQAQIEQLKSAFTSPTVAALNCPVQLIASASADCYPSLVYHWDFGDGNTMKTFSATTNHSYSAIGDYTVKLVVTSPDHNPVQSSKVLLVRQTPFADHITYDGNAWVDLCYYSNPAPTILGVVLAESCDGGDFSYEWQYRQATGNVWMYLGSASTYSWQFISGQYYVRCIVSDTQGRSSTSPEAPIGAWNGSPSDPCLPERAELGVKVTKQVN